jgi:hypothetical protein
MSVIHRCKLHCHTIDPLKLEVMGMDDDIGKWLPFSFHMGIIIACKLSTDEEDLTPFGCTTVFTEAGDAYIIDTPYAEFEEKFVQFNEEDSNSSSSREASL